MKHSHLIIVFLIIFCGCKSSEKLVEKKETKQDLINFLFQDYIGEKPSASFIVVKDGKIRDCQSFGYADLENKILANCETNYRLASVTKQFTAMGILVLINQGKLSYDTRLTEVLPEFPEYGKEITIKNLMSHRSGLQDYSKLYPKDAEKQLVDKEVLNLLIKQDSLLFPANSNFKYSNSGYAVLAMIIERVSGKSFKEFMDKEIFEKTGMANSTVYLKDLQIKNRAYGYKFNDTIYENKDQNIWSAIQGDGGIYSSVNDYVHWDSSLYDETLVKTDLRNDAFSNWDENGKTDGKGYGFGWQIDIKNNRKYLMHGGSTTGFLNYSLRIPSEKIAVVIYTNTTDYGGLGRKAHFLASYYSDGKLPIPADVLLEKDIEENGIENSTNKFNQLKSNTTKYDIVENDLVSLGFRYMKKESEKALKIFELVKTEFPNYLGGYFGLAQYYKAKENNEKAVNYFTKVIEVATSENQRQIDYSKKMIKQLSE
ncbi:beta-lactamase family protein [Aurantibacter crassamenti]|uniref:serine hydrolase domain-containing protein n=1 Tax=Aurantibacter crassamenti TaxID=1837375 RepID=UPI00193AA14F|nr:serine hydrolase domain-containing protein [Aurantibacter crassamenti]MBM1106385.1 beta-lactamase family protein [Aurantibacter crassamenti]